MARRRWRHAQLARGSRRRATRSARRSRSSPAPARRSARAASHCVASGSTRRSKSPPSSSPAPRAARAWTSSTRPTAALRGSRSGDAPARPNSTKPRRWNVQTMRAARIHDICDLRVEQLPVPEPGPRDLLIRIEACGICPTDVRKYRIGVNDGTYPFNPGHEWLGRVEAVGSEVEDFSPGQRVYGDTYAGYAEYAVIGTDPRPWSYGPLALDDEVPRDRAIFIEPLADCLHAIHDQAKLAARRASRRGRGRPDGAAADRGRSARRRVGSRDRAEEPSAASWRSSLGADVAVRRPGLASGRPRVERRGRSRRRGPRARQPRPDRALARGARATAAGS